jgi:phosphohistidine phosphatase
MQLYLVQHGKAKPEEEDAERRLTENGIRDVQRVDDFLRGTGVSVDAISHSGKPRAQQSAELLANTVAAPTKA